ncbi:MAG TPA: peptidoglycan DD-metalloendopeptidase family protein, partial [Balneolaceae bacterium]|nr:peptidoglycan DD-metalloendopeptidase family protein [Balneolaceae bacterium]
KRNIHIGIDIWSEAGQPVFSFYKGIVCYMANHDQKGNYGPTLVIRYTFSGKNLYALFGHLSVMTLNNITVDKSVRKGEKIATIGTESENGGWPPHLHFQLCRQNPGKADMPGVVSEENRGQALKKYPDPRLVLGPLY